MMDFSKHASKGAAAVIKPNVLEKFKRVKFDSLDGNTKVRFYDPLNEEFYVEATPSGIEVNGRYMMDSMKELEFFAALVSEAQREWFSLRRKIVSTASGHE